MVKNTYTPYRYIYLGTFVIFILGIVQHHQRMLHRQIKLYSELYLGSYFGLTWFYQREVHIPT